MTYLVATRGDTFQATFIWTNSSDVAINLTGYTVTLTVTVNGLAEDYTAGDGLTITAAQGKIAVSIADEITEEWSTDCTYRLRVVSPSGDVTTLVRGTIGVS